MQAESTPSPRNDLGLWILLLLRLKGSGFGLRGVGFKVLSLGFRVLYHQSFPKSSGLCEPGASVLNLSKKTRLSRHLRQIELELEGSRYSHRVVI